MANYILTLVGNDQPGIVAGVTRALFDQGLNLGEASMARLGSSFTIMLSVNAESADQVVNAVEPVRQRMALHAHVDASNTNGRPHQVPNVCVTVYGADRAGIVAQVTETLLRCDFNILHLETAVGGDGDKAIYVMQIEGVTPQEIEQIESQIRQHGPEGVEINVDALDLMVG